MTTPAILRATLLPALALGGGTPALAQLHTPLYVGATAGLNLATYAGSGRLGESADLQPGLALGLRAAYALSPRSAVQLEVGYAQKGVRRAHYQYAYRTPGFAWADNTYGAALHYLDVPLLFVYGPGSTGCKGPYAALGPQLSLALDKREWIRPTGLHGADAYEETLDTDLHSLRPVTASYVAAVGYQFGNGLGLELRYSGDLNAAYRPGNGAGSYYAGRSNDLRNSVWQLGLSVRLRGGRCAPTPAPGRPLPPPGPDPAEQVLREHPGWLRVARILTVLSWATTTWGPPGPGACPAPGCPLPPPAPPRPRGMARPVPLPSRPVPAY